MKCTFSVSEGFGAQVGAHGEKMRLGLMGGTFDPIHVGHLACAEAAREACGIDKVLFVPAGVPNFKQGRRLASGAARVELCKRALADFPYFDVCDIEVMRGGITYSVDTLRQLRGYYPRNVELCFIMGADSAASLTHWREPEALAQLATYVVISRPGQALDEALRAQLEEAGFTVEFVEGPQVDVSSSEIRERVLNGDSIEGMVPACILRDVEQEPAYLGLATGEEGVSVAYAEGARADAAHAEGASAEGASAEADPFSAEFFDARKRELAERVSPKRFVHCMGVVEACGRLASVYGVDVRYARLAGLLHDWDKGFDDPGIWARVDELGCREELGEWLVVNMPQVLHAHTAARALAREFPQIPAEIIRAIDRHTTAACDMTDLEMILYVADAIEDGRQFGCIDDLRAVVGQVSLEELFFLTYEYWVLLLFERRKQLHPDTISIWNTLVARRAARKETDDR